MSKLENISARRIDLFSAEITARNPGAYRRGGQAVNIQIGRFHVEHGFTLFLPPGGVDEEDLTNIREEVSKIFEDLRPQS